MGAYLRVGILLLVIFGSIATYLVIRLSNLSSQEFTPRPVVIAAETATVESWPQYLDGIGTIKAARGIALTAEGSGAVTAIHFDSGETVQQGQLLVELNDRVEQASKRHQQASLELAKLVFERDRQLIANKSISQTQFDQSRIDLERAEAELAETEARLETKRLLAPFGGTMGIRRVDLGDYVSPGTVIATLQDLSALEVEFNLPARQAAALHTGQRVILEVDAYPGRVFDAVVNAIEPLVDASTRNLPVNARIPDGEGLLPGMFAHLKLEIGDPAPTVTVPHTAVTYSLHGDTVFVLGPLPDSGTLQAQARVVKVGEIRDGRAAILSGIEPGEHVVTAGQNKIYPGATIEVDQSVEL